MAHTSRSDPCWLHFATYSTYRICYSCPGARHHRTQSYGVIPQEIRAVLVAQGEPKVKVVLMLWLTDVLHWVDLIRVWNNKCKVISRLFTHRAEGNWTPLWPKGRSAGIEMTHILRTTLATVCCCHSLFSPKDTTQTYRIEGHIFISSQTQLYNLPNISAIKLF